MEAVLKRGVYQYGTEGEPTNRPTFKENKGRDYRGNDTRRIYEGGSGVSGRNLYYVAYVKTTDAEAFYNAIVKAKSNNPYGAYVHAYDCLEYEKKDLYLSYKHTAGVAVTEDGDIVSVFRDPEGSDTNALHNAILTALSNGGIKLDCFDGFLPRMYARYGFRPIIKLKFDREYAPEGWDYERDGEPDIIFMAHNGTPVDYIVRNLATKPNVDFKSVPYAANYAEATELRDFIIKLRN